MVIRHVILQLHVFLVKCKSIHNYIMLKSVYAILQCNLNLS